MSNTLKMLTSQLSNVHFTRMFILLVEYGLVHRGETCYFCFDPAFVWPSLGRADFYSAQLVTGRRCASVVAIRSLSLFTDRADRCSQINSLHSDALPASVRRLTLFTDMLCQSVTVTCCSPFVHALSNKAGASQFMTDFLPLTAWSQVPPMSLVVCLSGTAVTVISLFLFS